MAKPKRRIQSDKAGEPDFASVVGGGTGSVTGSVLDLDKLIHERLRLGIVSALAVNPTMTFNELKESLGITDGNLSAHARKLEEAG